MMVGKKANRNPVLPKATSWTLCQEISSSAVHISNLSVSTVVGFRRFELMKVKGKSQIHPKIKLTFQNGNFCNYRNSELP